MTPTRWMAACAAALLLLCPAAAQDSGCDRERRVPATPAAAPYYYELAQILFPAQPPVTPESDPALWADLFQAVAKDRFDGVEDCETRPASDKRREMMKQRVAESLVRLARVFLRDGHYRAAELAAEKAQQLDPDSAAAAHVIAACRQAACVAAQPECTGETRCEPARPGCGAGSLIGTAVNSASGLIGAVVGTSRPSGCAAGCATPTGFRVRIAVRATCGCGEGCSCAGECGCGDKCKCRENTDGCTCGDKCGCAVCCGCGDKCACKKSAVKNVLIGGCCSTATAVCRPLPPVCMPLPVGQVTTPAGMCPIGCPMPQVCLPMPMPAVRLHVMPVATAMPPQVRFVSEGGQVRATSDGMDIRGDRVTTLDDGRVLFEGDVCLEFVTGRLPAKILAERIVVNLHDGSYEVNPIAVERRLVRQAGHFTIRQVGAAEVFPTPVSKPAHKPWGECKPASSCPVGTSKKWGWEGVEGRVSPRR